MNGMRQMEKDFGSHIISPNVVNEKVRVRSVTSEPVIALQ